MNELLYLHDHLAADRIQERVTAARRTALVPRQSSPRHRVASGLHRLADRLDV